ncbi:hypothetical protein BD410DRAFT_853505 [Rickenella mellea]|uniref:Uncharacterized protein n=2 Tax=Rickenella mellea TaxID=50990 RepID=A0A4Y7PLE5_9AGAM|nr:hypothetical protein BD410DRAFT_853505 [Rickenella mellea]
MSQRRASKQVDPADAPFPPSLRDGFGPPEPVTASGRKKRTRDDSDDLDLSDSENDKSANDFHLPSMHIRRWIDLFGNIQTIINDGTIRKAAGSDEDIDDLQSDRDHESFKMILRQLPGLQDALIKIGQDTKKFRALAAKIKESANSGRNNDAAALKKEAPCYVGDKMVSVLAVDDDSKMSSSKGDRGFNHDIIGRFLCPCNLDWDDESIRQDLRDGKIEVTADEYPLLMYENCKYDPDDMEKGLGRNKALLRTVKLIFTGRSSAYSSSPGGKTTKAGNAEIAGKTQITPRAIAYAACHLRFALSTKESWVRKDGDFDMEQFYWNVVGLFEDSGKFGTDLLNWWKQYEHQFISLAISNVFVDKFSGHRRSLPPPKPSATARSFPPSIASKPSAMQSELGWHSAMQPTLPHPAMRPMARTYPRLARIPPKEKIVELRMLRQRQWERWSKQRRPVTRSRNYS